MSSEPAGPEVQEFPAGTDTVYLVFDYETDGPVEIIAEIRSEEQQGAVIFMSRETYEGSGTASVEIPGPGSSAFPDGVYDTIIRFGEERFITAGWEWAVGDAPLPADARLPAPISPLEQSGSTAELAAGTSGGLDQAQTVQGVAPLQTTPGLAPIVLAGVAAVVLVLLVIIAWAVRGFMTAA